MTVVATPTVPTVKPSPLPLPLAEPKAPVLTHGGAIGTTTYGYKITATNRLGETAASPVGGSDLGNATLSGTNWNIISWQAVEHATGYKIYRTVGSVVPTLVGTVASTTLVFHDTGLVGTTIAPPTTNTTAGTVGTTTYSYVVTALLGLGETANSPTGITTTGKATLSSTTYNTVSWAKVTNARGV